jgi:hypothetical protein
MRVICINNTEADTVLTVGKIYVVEREERNVFTDGDSYYYLKDNREDEVGGWLRSRFKKLDDIRDEKINSILE